jgi:hypothetical protein
VQIDFSSTEVVLLIFLSVSLLSALVVLPLFKFYFTRSFAAYLLSLYAVFLVIVILVEVKVIHILD